VSGRASRRRRLWVSCALWLGLLFGWPERGAAQIEVIPPRVLSMPEIALPADVQAPTTGRVEALIEVETDGSATVTECDASDELCALVSGAIQRARFEPARRAGEAVPARVRIALRLAQPGSQPTAAGPGVNPGPAGSQPTAADSAQRTDAGQTAQPTAAGTSPAPPGAKPTAAGTTPTQPAAAGTNLAPPEAQPTAAGSNPAKPPASSEPDQWSARGRVKQQNQPGMRRLELAEMRDMPGAFGDPFRAVEALPGIVPLLSGLPYFYVRGAPPASTQYYYDDIPVPTLYHLGVAPAVIHPLMVGPITLYSGVAPARYGRLTGGVITGDGPPPNDGQTHFEAELRLLDVSAYAQTTVLGGELTAAVRYGYPGLLLSVLSPDVSLAYWDYQLRYKLPLSDNDRIELVALGSYDSLGFSTEPAENIRLQFHRFEPRLIHRVGRDEYGAALLLGWEQSSIGSGFQLKASRIGPRVWFEHKLGARERLRLSADMQGITGNFTSVPAVGEVMRDSERVGLFGDVPARSLWGVQAELTLRPYDALELKLGARADAWLEGAAAEAVVDPRARVILHVSEPLEFHVAAGIVHQPAVFFIPLPGVADLANDRGLQTALQSEAGVGWDTPLNFRLELQAFLHHYDNLVFTDTILLGDTLAQICATIDCHGAKLPSRIDGWSYGAELFIRRPITERLSGFLSYTLAWSAINNIAGMPYTPSWDVRHVANLVLQWKIGAGFSAGIRMFMRSGKMNGEFVIDPNLHLARDEQRLPWFVRLDADVAYTWSTFWGHMRFGLEWFNVTMAREPEELMCGGVPRTCQTAYLPAIFFPNLSLRGEH
jgi:hypothetical protein